MQEFGSNSFPLYKFDLESNYESLLELNNLGIIAYQKDALLHNFSHITTETIQSNRFFIGKINPKRAADGHLRATISFDCREQMNYEKMQILQSTSKAVTLALVEGNMLSHHLMKVHAHFDVCINDDININGTFANDYHHCYYDMNEFKQLEDESLVSLPIKNKNAKSYYKPPPCEETEDDSLSSCSGENKSMDCSGSSGCSSGSGERVNQRHSSQFYGFIFDETEVQLPMRR